MEPAHCEPAPFDGRAYTSIAFVESRAILTYYVAGVPVDGVSGNNTWALKLRSIPIDWFHE